MASARGLGKLAALIANGGEIDGVRILKPETVELMHKDFTSEPDFSMASISGMKTDNSQGGVGTLK